MIAVYYPLKAHIYCTSRKSVMAIVILMIVMCKTSVPILFTGSAGKADGQHVCISFGSGSVLETLYSVIYALVYSIIPCCIICVLSTFTVK